MYESPFKSAGITAVKTEGKIARPVTIDGYFRIYGPELLGFLKRRLKQPDQAFDIVQTAFERLVAGFSGGEDIRHPRALLHRIARNAMIDQTRHEDVQRRHHAEMLFPDPEDAVDHCTPEYILEQRERLGQLAVIIRGLPPKRRRIFILSRLHHLPLAEIARQEHMSKRAVRGHIERALADIRAGMDDERDQYGGKA